MQESPSTLAGMLSVSNRIEELLVQSQGEITDEISILLKTQDVGVPAKVDAIVFILKKLEASGKMFTAEAERYAKVASGLENSKKWLWDYVKSSMSSKNMTDLHGDVNRFALIPGKAKLVIDDVNLLPDECVTPIITRKPLEEEIRKRILAGIPVPGAHLETVQSLRIYASKKKEEKK